MRPLNILMLTTSYPKWPGEPTAPFIEEIAAGLVRRGHTVHVVLPHHPELRHKPVERGVHLHPFRYAPHPALAVWGYAAALKADVGLRGAALVAAPLGLGASLLALLRLTGGRTAELRNCRTENREPRTQNPEPIIDGQQRPAAMATAGHQLPATSYQPQIVHRPSSTVHRPSFDLIHAHWVIPNGLPALIAARLRGLPLFISLHGSDVYVAEKAAPIAATARGLFRAAQGTTACSGDLYQRALRLGAPHSRIEVVPYGVDTTAFRPDPGASVRVRAELGLPPDAKLVVSVSRMVYKKGLTYLIDAFPAVLSHHPDATLVLGGYGDLREELEQRAIERGIAANVRFPGRLSREQSAAFLGAADIHVVPSVHDQAGNVDGLPNVLLEGMSSGRAIVASDLAGIPDVITDGVHGLLTPERNSAALAKAIIHLFDDPALARQLGEAARRRVLNELTWDAAAERFETMYVRGLEGDGRIAGGL